MKEKGLIILSVGNFHTIAAMIIWNEVKGIYAHHTELLTPARLHEYLNRFKAGVLTNEEIFEDGGYGFAYSEGFRPGIIKEDCYVAVTGPRRNLVKGLVFDFVAPYADMMLT